MLRRCWERSGRSDWSASWGRKAGRRRDLAVAAVVARIIDPTSKLATARALDPETASTSLGAVLKLGPVTGNEMLDMLDWLLERQPWIERSLANRHLKGSNTLILYDVSSSYLEGRCCPLAAFGHNRDGKKGKMQVIYGLLCAADGCPVAVEVFAGNAGGPVHGGGPGGQGPKALRDRARRAGGRPGDADDGADPQGPRACGARLDLGPEDRGHPKAAEGRRPGRPGPRWIPRRWFPTRSPRSRARTSPASG